MGTILIGLMIALSVGSVLAVLSWILDDKENR